MRRFVASFAVAAVTTLLPLVAMAGDPGPGNNGGNPVSAVPEPAAALAFAAGALVVAAAIRRSRRD